MNLTDPSCACGKTFGQENALSNHRRVCAVYHAQASTLLQKAQVAWRGRKRTFAEARLSAPSTSKRARSNDPPTELLATLARDSESDCHTGNTKNVPDVGSHGASLEPLTSTATVVETSSTLMEPTAQTHNAENTPAGIRTRYGRLIVRPARFPDPKPRSVPVPPKRGSKTSGESQNLEPTSGPSATSSNESTNATASKNVPFRTTTNQFGLLCQYDHMPDTSHSPNGELTLVDLSDIQQHDVVADPEPATASKHGRYWPYPNESSFLLGEWMWNGNNTKSQAEFRRLLDIITNPAFEADDVRRTSWDRVDNILGDSTGAEWMEEFEDAGWIRETVQISVPFHSHMNPPGPKVYEAGQFLRRSVVSVLKERLCSTEARHFHFEPYELYWKPSPASEECRVHGELYNSPAFLEAHRKLQASPPEPGCTLQRVVVALMLSSDETHLTQFGDTKLWPLYMFFGNDSKDRRSKSSLNLCNHLAYFIKLPDTFKDFVCDSSGGRLPTAALIAHCQRELLHAQLELLFDEEFLHAVAHGVVITCFDSIARRFYLRVFTHSADYKEKVMLTGIPNLGKFPCPRCLIPLSQVHRMGMKQDRRFRQSRARVDDVVYRSKINTARAIIYKQNRAVNNPDVKDTLKEMSLAPTQTAFSSKLSKYGFNAFSAMVVDLMHEVESGNWRSVFIHILRILTSVDDRLVHEMDRRYRETPTFGGDTIRKFRRNCSEMRNLAARDWEDMLQCAIPVFDGLLSGTGNTLLLDLLFLYGHWHGLAKLRLHTDHTLELLDTTTQALGAQMRKFRDKTSAMYDTRELKKEQAARLRRKQASAAKKTTNKTTDTDTSNAGGDDTAPRGFTASTSPRRKLLNLETYKFHALGDYVESIRQFGTTDSYSTELGELEHRKPKSQYARTSKKDFIRQLSQIERRQARVRRIRDKLTASRSVVSNKAATTGASDSQLRSVEAQYVVGRGQNEPINLPGFMRDHRGDPAVEGFMSKLKKHLLPQACKLVGLSEEEAQSRLTLLFQRDSMYRHRTIRFNYTTYDIRRAQDVINPSKSQRNVMTLAAGDDSTHPYLYCQVLGIFHVNLISVVMHPDEPPTHRIDPIHFLWVRWFEHHQPLTPLRMDTVKFPPLDTEEAFGFLDPQLVLQACHIIPAFSQGKSVDWGVQPLHSELAGSNEDWVAYYVGRFSDRDLLMRYHWGMAVGHLYSHPKDGHQSSLAADNSTPEVEEDPDQNAPDSEPAVDIPHSRSQSPCSSRASDREDELEGDFEEKEDEDLDAGSEGEGLEVNDGDSTEGSEGGLQREYDVESDADSCEDDNTSY